MTAVTSVLLLVVPSRELYLRVERHFGTKRVISNNKMMDNFDMNIVNIEFACSGDVLVLPKMYGTLDSEYARD